MASRPDANPPHDGITIHAIGDTHVGPVSSNESWRLDAVVRDSAKLPTPTAVVQLGDGCNNNPATDTAILSHFMGRLGAPWWAVMGNHDIANEGVTADPASATPALWASRLGYPAPSYTVDLPGLRLVMFSPSEQPSNYEAVSPAGLAWLDEAIGGTTNPVFVCCHFSLHGTHQYTDSIPWYIRTATVPGDSSEILDVLAAHPNVQAWISGHLHSLVDSPDLVTAVDLGGHRLAAINASCIWYCQPPPSPYPLDARETINTLYVTLLDDRIEVRVRDHGAGQWAAPNGRRVFSVNL